MVTEGGLNQWTEVGRQVLLGRGDGPGRASAQADRQRPGRQNDLARCKLTHDADQRPALAFGCLRRIVAMVNHPAEILQRSRRRGLVCRCYRRHGLSPIE